MNKIGKQKHKLQINFTKEQYEYLEKRAKENGHKNKSQIVRELINEKLGKCFTVNSKDLFDKNKNPNLSLSVKDVANNDNIPKKYL